MVSDKMMATNRSFLLPGSIALLCVVTTTVFQLCGCNSASKKTIGDGTLVARIMLTKKSFRFTEDIVIRFVLTNIGTRPVTFVDTSPEAYHKMTLSRKGSSWRHSVGPTFVHDKSFPVTVAPGESYSKRIDLKRFFSITIHGTYIISITFFPMYLPIKQKHFLPESITAPSVSFVVRK